MPKVRFAPLATTIGPGPVPKASALVVATTVPAEIVMPPVKVFAPASVSVPAPVLTRESSPVPWPMMLLKVQLPDPPSARAW